MFDKIKAKSNEISTNDKDGYSILTFNKKFISRLEKQFTRQSNKLYKHMFVSYRQPISLIPYNYNPAEVKHRMEIEDALNDEGIIAMKIDNDINDDNILFNVEQKMHRRNQKYMFININDMQVILCPNNQEQKDSLELILSNQILAFKNKQDVNFDYINKFGQKDIDYDEERLIIDELEEELINNEYIGDNILAQRLMNSRDPKIKIKIDQKYHKDLESMLLMLNINYAMINNTFVFDKKDFEQINDYLAELASDNLIIKEDAIYDKQNNIIIENPSELSKEPNIDLLIKTMDKEVEIEVEGPELMLR